MITGYDNNAIGLALDRLIMEKEIRGRLCNVDQEILDCEYDPAIKYYTEIIRRRFHH